VETDTREWKPLRRQFLATSFPLVDEELATPPHTGQPLSFTLIEQEEAVSDLARSTTVEVRRDRTLRRATMKVIDLRWKQDHLPL
jgi:hypothetical protein